jgi:hypothetical protein
VSINELAKEMKRIAQADFISCKGYVFQGQAQSPEYLGIMALYATRIE